MNANVFTHMWEQDVNGMEGSVSPNHVSEMLLVLTEKLTEVEKF